MPSAQHTEKRASCQMGLSPNAVHTDECEGTKGCNMEPACVEVLSPMEAFQAYVDSTNDIMRIAAQAIANTLLRARCLRSNKGGPLDEE
eukprot:632122-Pyramimonas_sp.AAC.1